MGRHFHEPIVAPRYDGEKDNVLFGGNAVALIDQSPHYGSTNQDGASGESVGAIRAWTPATGFVTVASIQEIIRLPNQRFCLTGHWSGFVDTAIGLCDARFLADGVQVGGLIPFFYNALLQHQGWSFARWVVMPTMGAIATFELQLRRTQAGGNFNQDANDYSCISVF